MINLTSRIGLSRDSCEKGWQFIIVALNFFPPTKMFESYLRGYIARHTEGKKGNIAPLAELAFKRFTRILETGRRQGQQSPSVDEVSNAIVSHITYKYTFLSR